MTRAPHQRPAHVPTLDSTDPKGRSRPRIDAAEKRGGSSVERTRVDGCPGVLAMHEAADGHLARIRVPGGRLSARQLDAIAELSADGNGIVEITARANFQVRGLAPGCDATAGRLLAAAGLLPSREHERARNIIASPLAGRHPSSLAGTDEVVDAIDYGLCADTALRRLPGRFLFAVDDGSGPLLGQRADVTLVAEPAGSGNPMFRLILDGVRTNECVCADEAGAVALAAARAFLEVRDAQGTGAWRICELSAGAAGVARHIGVLLDPVASHRRTLVIQPGIVEQRDGHLAVTALAPLGRLSREALHALATVSRIRGHGVRISPWRTVTLVDVARADGDAARRDLAGAGLVAEPGSGWQGLSACAGLGACAKANADVRAAAARRARDRDGRSPDEHWSACERRCGEPRAVAVSAVATGGRIVVSRAGARRQAGDLGEALALLATGAPA